MSTKIKFKRGTTAAVDAYTGDLAEPIFDSTKKILKIGDGTIVGSLPVVKSDSLFELEKKASDMRAICPSGFLPSHIENGNTVGSVIVNDYAYSTDTSNKLGVNPSLLVQSSGYSSANANMMAIENGPLKVNVNGYTLNLDMVDNTFQSSIVMELPTAPATGTRQDLVILEVWKEEVAPYASDDVFFPNGCVNFDSYNLLSTFDSCTLYSTTQSGGNYPLYLAGTYGNPSKDSSYHGKYVKANDTNIETFIKNPDNNVGVTEDGKFYQVRWRISTLSDHYANTGFTGLYDGTNYFRPQGQLASRSAKGSSTAATGAIFLQDGTDTSKSSSLDSGMFMGGTYVNTSTALSAVSGLSLDGFTYNIPIALIQRRNSTAWSLSNPNGAGSIASAVSGRPDDKYYDEVHKDDVLDLRHRVSPNGFDVKALQEETMQQLLKSDLASNWENLNMDPGGDGYYSDSDTYGTKVIRSEGVTGEDKELADAVFGTTGSDLITNGGFTSDTTDWTPGNSVILSSVAGGYSGNCLKLDNSIASYGYAYQAFTTTIDKLYKLSCYIKRGTSDPKIYIGTQKQGTQNWSSGVQYHIDSWTRVEHVFKATSTTSYLTFLIPDAIVGKDYFVDSVSIYEADAGTESAITQINTCNNSTSSRLDGMRNYFSDRPGEQVIYGRATHNTTGVSTSTPALFDYGTPATGNMWSLSKAQLSIDKGDEGAGNDTVRTYYPSVILDAGTYKCWYTGYDGSTNRIIYCEGPDGINWSNHTLSINIGDEGTYDATHIYHPSVILDAGTYKCWYTGSDGTNDRIIYCEGPDGINWSNHEMVIEKDSEGTYDTNNVYTPLVIKDGSTYKCWYSGHNGSNWRIIYCEGPDGINWSSHQMVIDRGVEGTYDTSHAYTPCIILDGTTYKIWYTGYDGANYRIIYNEACHGIRLNAKALAANDGSTTDRPEFSGRYPDIYWGDAVNNSSYLGKGCKVDMDWWTESSLDLTGDLMYGEIKEETWSKFTISAASTLVVGDTYTVDAVVCTVKSWNSAKTTLWVTYTGATVVDTPGASTAHVGTGDASITVSAISNGDGNIDLNNDAISGSTALGGSYVGEGYDLHAAKSIFMNAYLSYSAGSGFLTRIPYDDHTTTYPDGRESIKATQFYIDGTQVIPEDGFGWRPFGSQIEDDGDGAGEPDTHCKSTGLTFFLRNDPVIYHGAEGTYDVSNSSWPKIIKDGSIYKCWYSGFNGTWRTIYCEGPDGVNWSNHQLSIDIGDEGTYDTTHITSTSVIKDGSIYRCLYSGHDGSNYRTIYCEGSDGINWSNHQLSIDIGDEGTYDTGHAYHPNMIKDGSIYKCWYSGDYGDRIYCEGSDGINWSNHQLVIKQGLITGCRFSEFYIMKEGNVYKCWAIGYYPAVAEYRLFYLTSTDGKNWSKPMMFKDHRSDGGVTDYYLGGISVIKDDKTYKVWYGGMGSGNYKIIHAVLTMTDTNNTGSAGSLLGVYSTEGTQNFAPGPDDSVLVMYEHRALQGDFSRLGGSDPSHTLTYTLKYLDDNAIITSMGTTGSPANYPSNYRDVISTMYPTMVDADGSSILLYSQPQYNEDDVLTLKNFVKYIFTNNMFPKVGDYVSLASLDMNTINGINVYATDSSYNAFGGGDIYVDRWSGGNGSIIISGVGEKNKELFIPITFTTGESSDSDPVCNDVILINAIGRPVVR